MKISDFSIKNYQFTVVIFLLLALVGLSSFRDIPRTEDPYFDISAFRINILYPGADPYEIEQQVIKPIEDAVRSLDDVRELLSTSRDSGGVVFIRFIAEVDVDKKFDEVSRELAAIRGDLPSGVLSLEIERINPGFTNIIQYALVSDTASYADLALYAEELSDAYERIDAVREAEEWAYPEQQVRVSLNFKRLAELGINPLDVVRVIQGQGLNIPAGPIEEGGRRLNIQTSGQYRNIDEIRDTVIFGTGTGGELSGRVVRVRDVADVQWGYESQNVLARFDGQRAVFVTANQKEGRNIFDTQKAIDEVTLAFEKTLPSNIVLERGFEQYRNVDKRLSRLEFDFGLAVTLVLLTLLPLGLRASGIVMVSVPLSLLIGISCLYFTGFSLNQLSIAGLVVALGLLVDDSIVVIENIARYLRMGHNRVEAAKLATKQISLAVVGCTATLLFAFLPLLMLPDNAGKFIRSLPASVVFTVLGSLFVALTIIPFLASRMLKKEENEHGNIVLQKLTGLIDRIYSPLLHRALRTPKTVVAGSLILFVASLGLAPIMGLSLFPKANTPQFMIEVSLPAGSSVTRTDAVVRQIESTLNGFDEVTAVLTTVGEGNPQIYYNVFQSDPQSNVANVFVQIEEYTARTPAFLDALRNQLARISGANIIVREFENGPPIDAPIGIRLSGPDLDKPRLYAGQIEAIMTAHPATLNIDNPQRTGRTDLRLKVNTEKAGLLGVNTIELDQALRLAVAGSPAGEIRNTSGDSYTISVRGPAGARSDLSALDDFHVIARSGAAVPLSQLTTLELDDNLNSIYRYNRERAVLLTGYTVTGYNAEKVTLEIAKQIDDLNMDRGYKYELAGTVKSRQESFAGFGTALLITVFGILAVLILEFGSFKSTLIVLFVIPLGVTGGMVTLFLTGNTISFTAMVGFIALIGIEIKNSILLVDFTNQLREQGRGLDESIEEAGRIRFLPILLTSATAVGGLMPLALQGGGLYAPMAWVIIGGLLSSTFIGRLVTPVLYKLLPPEIQVQSGGNSSFDKLESNAGSGSTGSEPSSGSKNVSQMA